MELAVFALPVLMGILNRYPRGVLAWGPYVVGLVVGLAVYLISGNVYAAATVAGLYIAGETFGWGKWLSTVPRWDDPYYVQNLYNGSGLIARDDGKNNGIHWLANKVFKETEDFKNYSILALMIRGFYWYAPILLALALFGITPFWLAGVLSIAVAISMPISYFLAYLMFGETNYWSRGEHIFGVVQGIALSMALTV
jgi:hypothetical protein